MRTLKDDTLKSKVALPSGAATTNGNAINLGPQPYEALRAADLLIEVPATPALADTKTITFKLQDSADNVTFNDLVSAVITLTGAGGAGAAAASKQLALPLNVRQYLRLVATGVASGGDSSGVTAEAALVF